MEIPYDILVSPAYLLTFSEDMSYIKVFEAQCAEGE
jgi:hypothetical protein